MKIYTLLLFVAISITNIVTAQDIFEQCGFDKEALTLSGGRYNEFFDNEEIVQIGTTLLNTKTNKIVAFIDESDSKENYLSEFSSRWLSVDPLAAIYPQVSPYVYVKNNPIIRIDPDGREDILIKQIKNSSQTTAESAWLIYPTGTLDGANLDDLRSMTVADITTEFGKPSKTQMGSSLPDNPSKSDNDKTGNATVAEGKYTYEKGKFKNGTKVLFLNEGNGNGVVTTEKTNYKNNHKGEKKALGVAAHAGRVDWQKDVLNGKETTKAKGSEGCPTTTGFGNLYNTVENTGNIVIVRDPEKDE